MMWFGCLACEQLELRLSHKSDLQSKQVDPIGLNKHILTESETFILFYMGFVSTIVSSSVELFRVHT
jgi:hypothetical protein